MAVIAPSGRARHDEVIHVCSNKKTYADKERNKWQLLGLRNYAPLPHKEFEIAFRSYVMRIPCGKPLFDHYLDQRI